MREIKFRSYTPSGMVEIDKIVFGTGWAYFKDLSRYQGIDIEEFPLLQNTGVYDDEEDRTEIYEDDIVEIIYEQEKHICVVKYESGGFLFIAPNLPDGYIFFSEIVEVEDYSWIPDSKVIGNIYENPELLEG